jgi:hypothetical protein
LSEDYLETDSNSLTTDSTQSHEKHLQFVKKLVENYPNSYLIHQEYCTQLLPYRGRNKGMANRYLSSLAEVVPAPFGDQLYTKASLEVFEKLKNDADGRQLTGITVTRLMRGVDSMLKRHEILQSDVEKLMALAASHNRIDIVEKIANYHIHNFAIHRFSPSHHIRTLFINVRDKMYQNMSK